jgi:hypothetical protein
MAIRSDPLVFRRGNDDGALHSRAFVDIVCGEVAVQVHELGKDTTTTLARWWGKNDTVDRSVSKAKATKAALL